jgi:hypothetical protein
VPELPPVPAPASWSRGVEVNSVLLQLAVALAPPTSSSSASAPFRNMPLPTQAMLSASERCRERGYPVCHLRSK